MSNKPEEKKLTIGQRLAAAHAGLATGENNATKLADLEKEHGVATAEIDRLTQALAGAEKLAGDRLTELNAANGKIGELTKSVNDLTVSNENLKAEVDGLKRNTGSAVAAEIAKIGVKPEDAPKAQDPGSTKTREEHLKEYNSLIAQGKPGEAARYWAKHQNEMLT